MPVIQDSAVPNDDPLDLCFCGDYRRDHKDGKGACIFSVGSRGDGHFGSGYCDAFRLHRRARQERQP